MAALMDHLHELNIHDH